MVDAERLADERSPNSSTDVELIASATPPSDPTHPLDDKTASRHVRTPTSRTLVLGKQPVDGSGEWVTGRL